ncbi:MAG: outer membrane receptor protein, partial [Muribaculaceae bacterium]|nr:outer membrane receptor protein [Muribaculaceae bacterium]
RQAINGSRIDKRGVEFQLNTSRWTPVATSLIVSGAWFRSRYSNSQMLFDPISAVVDGKAVSDRYIGLYDSDDGRICEQFNTNFMFDTQIPKLGLIFSTTFQCMWYVKTRRLTENGVPVSYLDAADGLLHPYDPDKLSDPALAFLTRYYNPDLYSSFTIPTAVYVNIKATKNIGRFMRVSVFVNRILDYLPDYTSNGITVRRKSDAYFGMELNFTL